MKHGSEKFDELEALLRHWKSLSGDENYDFVGMLHLFRACVLNLAEHSTADDWSDAYELLEPPEREFLTRLVEQFRRENHSSKIPPS